MNFGLICCQILVNFWSDFGLIFWLKKWSKMTIILIFSGNPSNQSIDPFFQPITYVTLYESSHESFRKKVLLCGLFLVACWSILPNLGFDFHSSNKHRCLINTKELSPKLSRQRYDTFFELTILSPKLSQKLFNHKQRKPARVGRFSNFPPPNNLHLFM